MLKRAGENIDEHGAACAIKDADYPVPFAPGLEYNPPAHGTWNIVHTGMRVPESIQIYVCSANCMRGVVLTAAEMNMADRFSFVILEEKDLVGKGIEDATIEGVADVISKRKGRPKAVLLFTVCLHHFLGCDYGHIYGKLKNRFPDIIFVRCYMDPIMQKTGMSPDQKLRKSMYDMLPELPAKMAQKKNVTLLGSDFAMDESSDIKRILERHGGRLLELPKCKDWKDYLELSNSTLFICVYPSGLYGAKEQALRLGREFLYLPMSFDYEKIRECLEKFSAAINASPLDYDREIEECDKALLDVRRHIGDIPIALDASFHPRPLNLARLLIKHGFNVEKVYLDTVSPEEEEDFRWLKYNAPDLLLMATTQAKMRILPRCGDEKVLALGQKASYFTGTGYFVNMVQGGGLYGYDGIKRLAGLMTRAFDEEKDTKDLIVRKGWGCDSCI